MKLGGSSVSLFLSISWLYDMFKNSLGKFIINSLKVCGPITVQYSLVCSNQGGDMVTRYLQKELNVYFTQQLYNYSQVSFFLAYINAVIVCRSYTSISHSPLPPPPSVTLSLTRSFK